MRPFALLIGTLTFFALSPISNDAEAANPRNNNPQQQTAKQRQALQRKQALEKLTPAQRKAHIKNVVLPKLRTRIANEENKIKSKDKLINAENKRLAAALTQRQRAQEQLDATGAQIEDVKAADARRPASPAALEQKLQKLRQRKQRLQTTLTEARSAVEHHTSQIRTLNGERKVHTDRLAKNLKQKRDGKEILSGKGIMRQYGESPIAAGGEGQYAPAPNQPARAQAIDARPSLRPVQYQGGPAQQAAQAVNPADPVPANVYGQLALRPAGQQTAGPRPNRPVPQLQQQADAAGDDNYQALPNAALQAQRGFVQAVDGNGNQVMLPPAPPPAPAARQ